MLLKHETKWETPSLIENQKWNHGISWNSYFSLMSFSFAVTFVLVVQNESQSYTLLILNSCCKSWTWPTWLSLSLHFSIHLKNLTTVFRSCQFIISQFFGHFSTFKTIFRMQIPNNIIVSSFVFCHFCFHSKFSFFRSQILTSTVIHFYCPWLRFCTCKFFITFSSQAKRSCDSMIMDLYLHFQWQ